MASLYDVFYWLSDIPHSSLFAEQRCYFEFLSSADASLRWTARVSRVPEFNADIRWFPQTALLAGAASRPLPPKSPGRRSRLRVSGASGEFALSYFPARALHYLRWTAEQFSPITSTRSASRVVSAAPMSVPRSMRPEVSSVTCTCSATGRPAASR